MAEVNITKCKVLVALVMASAAAAGIASGFYFLGLFSVKCKDCQTVTNPSATGPVLSRLKQDGRLPRNIIPLVYQIELFPDIYGDDPRKFTFTGFVSLHFLCVERTNTIVMNINNINVTAIILDNANFSAALDITDYSIDTKWQFLTINSNHTLVPGAEYVVELYYTGPLKNDFAGLYLSTFLERTDKSRYVAATQFSPTDARKAFPCLDEPDRKARFDIIIVRREDFVSLSNMHVISQEARGSGFVADVFERTPEMSPYLVAMVVGKLSSLSTMARAGLNLTAWAGHETIAKTETALNVAAKILVFFEDYFGIDFPLSKLDILALPETAVGAMENWGLIIFNNERIFYNESEYSLSSLKNSMTTIVHEVAHQWFGNLVTMNWWSDLMLKEGFAVYFENVGIAHVFPGWSIENEFPVSYMHEVFKTDGLLTSHPVYKQLADTTEIRQVFDDISYRKSGCLMRMVHFILGDTDFQGGLQHYLRKYQYYSVGHNDLWTALEERRTVTPSNTTYTVISGKKVPSVKEVMDTWVHQMNFPFVTITQQKPGVLLLTQERFTNDGVRPAVENFDSPFNYTWIIPFTYTTNSAPRFNHDFNDILWMRGKHLIIIDRNLTDLHEPGNWLVANIKQYGYYRVNYDNEMWTNLLMQLRNDHLAIHTINRAQIINDLFSFGKASIVNYSLALSSLEYLENEYDFVPWLAAFKEIGDLDNLLKNTSIYRKFAEGIVNITTPLFDGLRGSYGTMPITQKLNFVQLYSLACHLEMKRCVEESVRTFDNWANAVTKQAVDPDLRSSVMCTAIAFGSPIDFEFVLHMYNLTLNSNEKAAYLKGLACTRDDGLQNRLIALSMDTYTIQGREAIDVLVALARNKLALDNVWTHIKGNWSHFMEAYAGSLFLLNKLVKGVTSQFVTVEQLYDMELFMNSTADLGPAEQAFNQAKEKISSNIKWLEKHYTTIEDWVNRKHPVI